LSDVIEGVSYSAQTRNTRRDRIDFPPKMVDARYLARMVEINDGASAGAFDRDIVQDPTESHARSYRAFVAFSTSPFSVVDVQMLDPLHFRTCRDISAKLCERLDRQLLSVIVVDAHVGTCKVRLPPK
jgi:hypothetical protein